jgi:transcriptional regulator with XRE-family HTH domain
MTAEDMDLPELDAAHELPGGTHEASALAVFASELRAQRQRAGWTQIVLGDKMGYSGSFISDIERCARTPALDFARACDRELRLPGTFERMHELISRDAYPTWFYPVITFEQRASRIHEWEMRVIPGLLQTPDYARCVIRAGRPHWRSVEGRAASVISGAGARFS